MNEEEKIKTVQDLLDRLAREGVVVRTVGGDGEDYYFERTIYDAIINNQKRLMT